VRASLHDWGRPLTSGEGPAEPVDLGGAVEDLRLACCAFACDAVVSADADKTPASDDLRERGAIARRRLLRRGEQASEEAGPARLVLVQGGLDEQCDTRARCSTSAGVVRPMHTPA